MSGTPRDDEAQLRQTIHVLEEENGLLAERAEDSMLLGMISENIQPLENEADVFEQVLERISILKAIPFVACCRMNGTTLEPICSYCTFSDREEIGFPMAVVPERLEDLKQGLLTGGVAESMTCDFPDHLFRPNQVMLIPFKTQTVHNGAFLFFDDGVDRGRLASMQSLLGQVVRLAVSRHDHIYLLRELARSNKELESRVEQRTADLKETNRKLARSHETFVKVLDSMDATIYVADLKTYEILFMNQCMIDSCGKDLTGQTCYSALWNLSKPCDCCTEAQLLDAEGKPAGTVTRQEKHPVTGKYYICNERAIEWIDGNLVRLQIATDITMVKEMELQLLQAQKMEAIGTLAGGVAHDFNNLLMSIEGQATLLEMEMEANHPLLEQVKSSKSCTRSAADLTKQLLGTARGGKYEVVPVDINALLKSSSSMFGRSRHDIRIHTTLHEPPPVAMADRSQIEQVLLNLFVNAGHAMPDGGELFLETSVEDLSAERCSPHEVQPGRYIRIAVADTGTGMDEKTCRRAFDPFFSTKGPGHGTGLGLASAYGIIKNHAGFITLSSAPDKGASFEIFLPRSDRSVAPDEKKNKNPKPEGSSTILLVDDEEILLQVSSRLLTRLGYEVLVAQNGEQAIETVRQQKEAIDLVVLDMIMPGLDGGATFDRMREIRPDLPVILSSGYSLNEKAESIMNRGCNGFIQKPFELADLTEKIEKLI